MNRAELEDAIRATLRENVQHVTAEDVGPAPLAERDPHPVARDRVAGSRPPWLAPALAAAAVLVIAAGVALAVARPWSEDRPSAGAPAPSASDRPAVAPSGTWRLTGVTIDARAVTVDATPRVTLTFRPGGTAIVDDGVNSTVIGYTASGGTLSATFRSTTYVLDGHANDPGRRDVLKALDALAPGATPHRPARSPYTLHGGQLVVRTSAGQLVFSR